MFFGLIIEEIMLTYKISDTVAVTSPVYIDVTEPPDCTHLWNDIPFTISSYSPKRVTLVMQSCEHCHGKRTKIVAATAADLDAAIGGK